MRGRPDLAQEQMDLNGTSVICRNRVKIYFRSCNFVFIVFGTRTAVKMLYNPSTVVHTLVGINIKSNRSFITGLSILVHIGENAQLFMFLLDFSVYITSFIQ